MKVVFRPDYEYKFSERKSKDFKDKLDEWDCYWDSYIVSDDGAHYHMWVMPKPYDSEVSKETLNLFEYHAKYHGDPVSLSYGFIPDIVTLLEEHMTYDELSKIFNMNRNMVKNLGTSLAYKSKYIPKDE